MKAIAITALIALLLGAGIGSQLFPKIKTETVETEKEVIKRDVVTVVKEVVRADGTKEIITTTTDKTKEKKDSTVTSKVLASNYHASISVITDNIQLTDLKYQLQVEKRIIGDVFLGAVINSKKEAGLTVGLEF